MPAYPGSIKVNKRNRNTWRKNPEANSPQPVNPVLITEASANGSVLTLTFDDAVGLQGTPGITTDVAGAEPISAQLVAPNQVAITFDAAIAAATSLNIPHRDPAIRNSSGGYVISSTFPLAA